MSSCGNLTTNRPMKEIPAVETSVGTQISGLKWTGHNGLKRSATNPKMPVKVNLCAKKSSFPLSLPHLLQIRQHHPHGRWEANYETQRFVVDIWPIFYTEHEHYNRNRWWNDVHHKFNFQCFTHNRSVEKGQILPRHCSNCARQIKKGKSWYTLPISPFDWGPFISRVGFFKQMRQSFGWAPPFAKAAEGRQGFG